MTKIESAVADQLAIFLASNGNLPADIQQFLNNFPAPDYRRSMVSLILQKLNALAREEIQASGIEKRGEPIELIRVAGIMLEVLKSIMKGGKVEENRLLTFSELIGQIPAARDEDESLKDWAREIRYKIGLEVIPAGRARERSANPPY